MARDKISMPSSMAGITRYFDDYKSNVEISPMTVVIICAIVIVGLMALQLLN